MLKKKSKKDKGSDDLALLENKKEIPLKCPQCGREGINTLENLLSYKHDPLYFRYVSVYICPNCKLHVSDGGK